MAAFSGGSRFSDVFGKVAIVNHWPLLLRATADDESPIPGYMYPEISDLTHQSTHPQQRAAVLSFLQERLRKKSWHVKLKALQVMKYVALHGEKSFRDTLRRQATAIQEATKYNANPDPLHGSAPILAVRKAATELLEVLFDESLSGNTAASSIGKKMEGFGSVHSSPAKKTVSGTIRDNLQQLSSAISVPSFNQDKAYRSLHGNNHLDSGDPEGSHSTTELWNTSTGSYQPVMMTDGDECMTPESESGNSADKFQQIIVRDNGHLTVKTSSSSEGQSAGSFDLNQRLETVAVADWSHEVKLANDLASQGKASPVPSREEIDSFVKRASSLNCEKIIEILVTRIKTSEASQVACLCGIEAILREGLVSVDCILPVIGNDLQDLQNSTNRTVVAKANKIQRQLEQETSQSSNILTQQSLFEGDTKSISQPTASSPSTNLLFSGMSVRNMEFNKPAADDQFVKRGPLPASNSVSGNPNQESAWLTEHLADGSRGSQRTDLSMSIDRDQNSKGFGSLAEGMVGSSCERVKNGCQADPMVDLLTMNHQNRTNEMLEGMDALAVGKLSSATPEKQPSLKQLEPSVSAASGVFDAGRWDKASDPLLSRSANLSDLLQSLNPSHEVSPAFGITPGSGARAWNERDITVPKKQPSGTNVSQLYPQLVGAKLSSESSVPLQLGKSNGSFGFISAKSDTPSSKDSFDFVQEAMRGSQR